MYYNKYIINKQIKSLEELKMNMSKVIEITMELLEIKEEYQTKWTTDEIESFVEYIMEIQEDDEDYDVDQWLEETKMNCPELLQ